MNTLTISGKKIGKNQPIFIIAEAGVNHNGNLKTALKLIDAASFAGADAVKFQTFKAEQATTKNTPLAGYQSKNLDQKGSLLEQAKKWELKDSFYRPILERCRQKKIIFLSSPHGGFASVDFLQKIGVGAFKFGSGEITNLPFLEYAARLKKPVIISTGMATMAEVIEAVNTITKAGNQKIIILHCTTDYPCPPENVNLKAMQTMMKKLDFLVGYSDHTIGDQVSVMAATLDACLIEKHLTLDKSMVGPDHKASATPEEFKLMVEKIRAVGTILGSAVKKPTPKELSYLPIVRKSIVAEKNIKKGEVFSNENLAIKRPTGGMEPKFFYDIIGRRAACDITQDTQIKRSHLR